MYTTVIMLFTSMTASPDFQVRQRGTEALIAINIKQDIRPFLKAVSLTHSDPEVKWRCKEAYEAFYIVGPSKLEDWPKLTSYNGLKNKDWLDWFHTTHYNYYTWNPTTNKSETKWSRKYELTDNDERMATKLFIRTMLEKNKMTRLDVEPTLRIMRRYEKINMHFAPDNTITVQQHIENKAIEVINGVNQRLKEATSTLPIRWD